MSEYHFGSGRGKVSDDEARRCADIAAKHGARFIVADLPEGARFWFSCENAGHPFDAAVKVAVMAEVGEVETESAKDGERT
jgi:hypothetical protein